ncbi:MAG: Fic family protein [Chlamydiales bacterium]
MGIFSGIITLESLKISMDMLNRISEIDEFKGAWQQFGRLDPDRLSALKTVATIESIGSSTRIEGAKLSDGEVRLLLSGIEMDSLRTRDEQEVAGYALACEKIYEQYSAIPFTENSIKQLHIWLLQYSEKDLRHRGEYKKIPIRIEAFDRRGMSAGVLFETTSPFETPIKMHELVNWVNQVLEKKTVHSLVAIGIFIVIFLAIHPFQDGNGRLSRLLTTLLMLKCGYHYAPYSSLESVIEANKESYYQALQATQKSWQQGQPDWTPWLQFFLLCLQRQKIHLETKLGGEKVLAEKFSPLHKKILECLQLHGSLSVSEIEKLTQANRNTLKKALAKLVKGSLLVLEGYGKSTRYRLAS